MNRYGAVDALNPETQIVGSGHDPAAQTHFYVVEHGVQRWTVTIPDSEFDTFGPVTNPASRAARRAYLARMVGAAMQGPADASETLRLTHDG